MNSTIHPEHRVDHAITYDSESDRTILVGGHFGPLIPGDRDLQEETWVFDYNTKTWENMNPSLKPIRLGHKMAYDEESDLIILFGGSNYSDFHQPFNEVYTYDYNNNNWTLMTSILCPEDTSFYLLPIISFFAVITLSRKLRKRKV